MDIEARLKDFQFSYVLPLRWSDIDELRHVNNSRYLTYFEEARIRYNQAVAPWDWQRVGFLIASANVNYRRPLFLRDEPIIYVRTSRLGTKSFEMEYVIVNKNGELVADGTTTQVAIEMKTFQTIPIPEDIRQRMASFESGLSV